MDYYIPTVLENDMGPEYSECICPKCGEVSVHHVGVPCERFSCPKCGELMQRRGKEELEIKEAVKMSRVSKTTVLPDGSAFFTATVGTKKKVKESSDLELNSKTLLETYLDFLHSAAKKIVTHQPKTQQAAALYKAYWGTKRGGKIPWPSRTASDVASAIK